MEPAARVLLHAELPKEVVVSGLVRDDDRRRGRAGRHLGRRTGRGAAGIGLVVGI
jgi:hypothetical protein